MTEEKLIDANNEIDTNKDTDVVDRPNDEILNKVMTAPVIYVREDGGCFLCPPSYKVYIHSEVISDGNFDILKDPLFNVEDDAKCCLFLSCSTLKFISPSDNNTIHYNLTLPKCIESCCPEKCFSCPRYGPHCNGSYGATPDMKFGYYAQRYYLCSCCGTPTWEFFIKGESKFTVEMECFKAFIPCNQLCELKFQIKNGASELGTIIRHPKGLCGTFTYQIQFPSEFTLEERLLLIAFCCKR